MLHPAWQLCLGHCCPPWVWGHTDHGASCSHKVILPAHWLSWALTVGHGQCGTQEEVVWGAVLSCCVFLTSMQTGAKLMPGSSTHALLTADISPPFPTSAWLCAFLLTRGRICPFPSVSGPGETVRRWPVLLWWWCSGHSGTCRESCLPVGPVCPACCLLLWKSRFSCETPELSTWWVNKPSAVSFGGLEIHNYSLPLLRMGCSVGCSASKDNKRKRQQVFCPSITPNSSSRKIKGCLFAVMCNVMLCLSSYQLPWDHKTGLNATVPPFRKQPTKTN